MALICAIILGASVTLMISTIKTQEDGYSSQNVVQKLKDTEDPGTHIPSVYLRWTKHKNRCNYKYKMHCQDYGIVRANKKH